MVWYWWIVVISIALAVYMYIASWAAIGWDSFTDFGFESRAFGIFWPVTTWFLLWQWLMRRHKASIEAQREARIQEQAAAARRKAEEDRLLKEEGIEFH